MGNEISKLEGGKIIMIKETRHPYFGEIKLYRYDRLFQNEDVFAEVKIEEQSTDLTDHTDWRDD